MTKRIFKREHFHISTDYEQKCVVNTIILIIQQNCIGCNYLEWRLAYYWSFINSLTHIIDCGLGYHWFRSWLILFNASHYRSHWWNFFDCTTKIISLLNYFRNSNIYTHKSNMPSSKVVNLQASVSSTQLILIWLASSIDVDVGILTGWDVTREIFTSHKW